MKGIPVPTKPFTEADERSNSTAVATNIQTPDSSVLPASFEDVARAFGVTELIEEPSEWDLIENKDQLLGVPFAIFDIRENAGDFGTFASIEVLTEDGRRLVFNDGSTGCMEQAFTLTKKYGRSGGFIVRKGLRKSDYYFNPVNGEISKKQQEGFAKASTYYFDF